MTEKQIKEQNKVKLISFIILVIGLLLVLAWSYMKNNRPVTPSNNKENLVINYDINGSQGKYEYNCKTNACNVDSQAGSFVLVNDGAYYLINLSTKESKELKLPPMSKKFLVARDEYYGLVYTKTDTNNATFYEGSKDRSLFDDSLDYGKMNSDEIKNYLIRLYPMGLFYAVSDTSGRLYDLNNQMVLIDNVSGIVLDGVDLYIISNQGVASVGEDKSLTQHLTNVKKVYAYMYDHKFVVLDNDNNLKLATVNGEVGNTLMEIGNRNVQSLSIVDNKLKVIVEAEDYATSRKTNNYEYDFATNQLKTMD